MSDSSCKPNLVYTIAFDPPNSPGNRFMAKLLVSSLLRTRFTGDIVVLRNTEEPLFQVERTGLKEIFLESTEFLSPRDQEIAWSYKYRARKLLPTEGYDKVLFLDADCLVLANIDLLLDGKWDIKIVEENQRSIKCDEFSCFLSDDELTAYDGRFGINSGTFAVRAECFYSVMESWELIDSGLASRKRFCSDQGSWNRLILDTRLLCTKFPQRAVQFPLFSQPAYHDWKMAHIVHAMGGTTREKMRFLWGIYMQTFYFDDAGTMLSILEI